MAWRIGLTGGLACGKSTIAAWLAEAGAHIIDADLLAREIVAPGTPALAAIAAHFGPQMLNSQGILERAALRQRVFADAEARAWLEALLHPPIRAAMIARSARIAAAHPDALIVWVVPLLLEGGYGALVDQVVVVDCLPEQQMARVKARSDWSDAQIRTVLAAQCDRATRLAAADVVIDNSGSPAAARRQLREFLATLHPDFGPNP
ncbi:MAG: dephospho-CoA kinase [Acidithiobacillus sp.]|uniref:dephospho-CoA kinase n=1 Tax=Acidithiobacillus sp. TaxID=1872118 RepID=UPI003CFC5848